MRNRIILFALTVLTLYGIANSAQAQSQTKRKYDVAAFLYPAYASDDVRLRPFWPMGIGEWETVMTMQQDIWEDYEELFTHGEKVRVKFAQMDSTSYEFWKSYEVMSSISRNPLFPATEDLKSNIQGALGYWIGYGADEVTVEIDNIH